MTAAAKKKTPHFGDSRVAPRSASTGVDRALIPARVHDPPPGGIDLTRVPLVPPAATALPPEELARRLEHYAARDAGRLPLFHDGPPAAADAGVQCMGCGTVPPKPTWLPTIGWTTFRNRDGMTFMESYCPDCAAGGLR